MQAQETYDGSSKCKILEPRDIANAVLYAVSQPEYVGVNEILIEPREAPAWWYRNILEFQEPTKTVYSFCA